MQNSDINNTISISSNDKKSDDFKCIEIIESNESDNPICIHTCTGKCSEYKHEHMFTNCSSNKNLASNLLITKYGVRPVKFVNAKIKHLVNTSCFFDSSNHPHHKRLAKAILKEAKDICALNVSLDERRKSKCAAAFQKLYASYFERVKVHPYNEKNNEFNMQNEIENLSKYYSDIDQCQCVKNNCDFYSGNKGISAGDNESTIISEMTDYDDQMLEEPSSYYAQERRENNLVNKPILTKRIHPLVDKTPASSGNECQSSENNLSIFVDTINSDHEKVNITSSSVDFQTYDRDSAFTTSSPCDRLNQENCQRLQHYSPDNKSPDSGAVLSPDYINNQNLEKQDELIKVINYADNYESSETSHKIKHNRIVSIHNGNQILYPRSVISPLDFSQKNMGTLQPDECIHFNKICNSNTDCPMLSNLTPSTPNSSIHNYGKNIISKDVGIGRCLPTAAHFYPASLNSKEINEFELHNSYEENTESIMNCSVQDKAKDVNYIEMNSTHEINSEPCQNIRKSNVNMNDKYSLLECSKDIKISLQMVQSDQTEFIHSDNLNHVNCLEDHGKNILEYHNKSYEPEFNDYCLDKTDDNNGKTLSTIPLLEKDYINVQHMPYNIDIKSLRENSIKQNENSVEQDDINIQANECNNSLEIITQLENSLTINSPSFNREETLNEISKKNNLVQDSIKQNDEHNSSKNKIQENRSVEHMDIVDTIPDKPKNSTNNQIKLNNGDYKNENISKGNECESSIHCEVDSVTILSLDSMTIENVKSPQTTSSKDAMVNGKTSVVNSMEAVVLNYSNNDLKIHIPNHRDCLRNNLISFGVDKDSPDSPINCSSDSLSDYDEYSNSFNSNTDILSPSIDDSLETELKDLTLIDNDNTDKIITNKDNCLTSGFPDSPNSNKNLPVDEYYSVKPKNQLLVSIPFNCLPQVSICLNRLDHKDFENAKVKRKFFKKLKKLKISKNKNSNFIIRKNLKAVNSRKFKFKNSCNCDDQVKCKNNPKCANQNKRKLKKSLNDETLSLSLCSDDLNTSIKYLPNVVDAMKKVEIKENNNWPNNDRMQSSNSGNTTRKLHNKDEKDKETNMKEMEISFCYGNGNFNNDNGSRNISKSILENCNEDNESCDKIIDLSVRESFVDSLNVNDICDLKITASSSVLEGNLEEECFENEPLSNTDKDNAKFMRFGKRKSCFIDDQILLSSPKQNGKKSNFKIIGSSSLQSPLHELYNQTPSCSKSETVLPILKMKSEKDAQNRSTLITSDNKNDSLTASVTSTQNYDTETNITKSSTLASMYIMKECISPNVHNYSENCVELPASSQSVNDIDIYATPISENYTMNCVESTLVHSFETVPENRRKDGVPKVSLKCGKYYGALATVDCVKHFTSPSSLHKNNITPVSPFKECSTPNSLNKDCSCSSPNSLNNDCSTSSLLPKDCITTSCNNCAMATSATKMYPTSNLITTNCHTSSSENSIKDPVTLVYKTKNLDSSRSLTKDSITSSLSNSMNYSKFPATSASNYIKNDCISPTVGIKNQALQSLQKCSTLASGTCNKDAGTTTLETKDTSLASVSTSLSSVSSSLAYTHVHAIPASLNYTDSFVKPISPSTEDYTLPTSKANCAIPDSRTKNCPIFTSEAEELSIFASNTNNGYELSTSEIKNCATLTSETENCAISNLGIKPTISSEINCSTPASRAVICTSSVSITNENHTPFSSQYCFAQDALNNTNDNIKSSSENCNIDYIPPTVQKNCKKSRRKNKNTLSPNQDSNFEISPISSSSKVIITRSIRRSANMSWDDLGQNISRLIVRNSSRRTKLCSSNKALTLNECVDNENNTVVSEQQDLLMREYERVDAPDSISEANIKIKKTKNVKERVSECIRVTRSQKRKTCSTEIFSNAQHSVKRKCKNSLENRNGSNNGSCSKNLEKLKIPAKNLTSPKQSKTTKLDKTYLRKGDDDVILMSIKNNNMRDAELYNNHIRDVHSPEFNDNYMNVDITSMAIKNKTPVIENNSPEKEDSCMKDKKFAESSSINEISLNNVEKNMEPDYNNKAINECFQFKFGLNNKPKINHEGPKKKYKLATIIDSVTNHSDKNQITTAECGNTDEDSSDIISLYAGDLRDFDSDLDDGFTHSKPNSYDGNCTIENESEDLADGKIQMESIPERENIVECVSKYLDNSSTSVNDNSSMDGCNLLSQSDVHSKLEENLKMSIISSPNTDESHSLSNIIHKESSYVSNEIRESGNNKELCVYNENHGGDLSNCVIRSEIDNANQVQDNEVCMFENIPENNNANVVENIVNDGNDTNQEGDASIDCSRENNNANVVENIVNDRNDTNQEGDASIDCSVTNQQNEICQTENFEDNQVFVSIHECQTRLENSDFCVIQNSLTCDDLSQKNENDVKANECSKPEDAFSYDHLNSNSEDHLIIDEGSINDSENSLFEKGNENIFPENDSSLLIPEKMFHAQNNICLPEPVKDKNYLINHSNNRNDEKNSDRNVSCQIKNSESDMGSITELSQLDNQCITQGLSSDCNIKNNGDSSCSKNLELNQENEPTCSALKRTMEVKPYGNVPENTANNKAMISTTTVCTYPVEEVSEEGKIIKGNKEKLSELSDVYTAINFSEDPVKFLKCPILPKGHCFKHFMENGCYLDRCSMRHTMEVELLIRFLGKLIPYYLERGLHSLAWSILETQIRAQNEKGFLFSVLSLKPLASIMLRNPEFVPNIPETVRHSLMAAELETLCQRGDRREAFQLLYDNYGSIDDISAKQLMFFQFIRFCEIHSNVSMPPYQRVLKWGFFTGYPNLKVNNFQRELDTHWLLFHISNNYDNVVIKCYRVLNEALILDPEYFVSITLVFLNFIEKTGRIPEIVQVLTHLSKRKIKNPKLFVNIASILKRHVDKALAFHFFKTMFVLEPFFTVVESIDLVDLALQYDIGLAVNVVTYIVQVCRCEPPIPQISDIIHRLKDDSGILDWGLVKKLCFCLSPQLLKSVIKPLQFLLHKVPLGSEDLDVFVAKMKEKGCPFISSVIGRRCELNDLESPNTDKEKALLKDLTFRDISVVVPVQNALEESTQLLPRSFQFHPEAKLERSGGKMQSPRTRRYSFESTRLYSCVDQLPQSFSSKFDGGSSSSSSRPERFVHQEPPDRTVFVVNSNRRSSLDAERGEKVKKLAIDLDMVSKCVDPSEGKDIISKVFKDIIQSGNLSEVDQTFQSLGVLMSGSRLEKCNLEEEQKDILGLLGAALILHCIFYKLPNLAASIIVTLRNLDIIFHEYQTMFMVPPPTQQRFAMMGIQALFAASKYGPIEIILRDINWKGECSEAVCKENVETRLSTIKDICYALLHKRHTNSDSNRDLSFFSEMIRFLVDSYQYDNQVISMPNYQEIIDIPYLLRAVVEWHLEVKQEESLLELKEIIILFRKNNIPIPSFVEHHPALDYIFLPPSDGDTRSPILSNSSYSSLNRESPLFLERRLRLPPWDLRTNQMVSQESSGHRREQGPVRDRMPELESWSLPLHNRIKWSGHRLQNNRGRIMTRRDRSFRRGRWNRP